MKRLPPALLLSALLLPVLLLAACAPAGTGPDAVCEREANDDPAVKLLMVRHAGNPTAVFNYEIELAHARDRARRACLRRLGAMPASLGGVEPVRRSPSMFKGM